MDLDGTPDLLLLIQSRTRIVQYRCSSISRCRTLSIFINLWPNCNSQTDER